MYSAGIRILTLMLLSHIGFAQQPAPAPTPPLLKIVGSPSFVIEPVGRGDQGHLYFEATLENQTDDTVYATISFTFYLSDGTRHSGCYPGDSFTVAPRERIFTRCSRSIVPTDIPGGKVTARLSDVIKLPRRQISSQVSLADSGLENARDQSDHVEAFARLRSSATADILVDLKYRFYDAGGVQVEECEQTGVLVEPEVELKTRCEWHRVTYARPPARVKVTVYQTRGK